MRITISGKQLKVGVSLQEYVRENIEAAITKYFENAISADVHFSKEAHLFVTDIVVNEGTGNQIFYKSQAKEDNNIYSSFDKALERMEKQLRRYKRRLKDHQKQGVSEAVAMAATKYVLQDDGQDADNSEDAPLIIAEKQTPLEELTVADAVMRMNLANLPALMFLNKKTGNYNVVYKREDGNISWIEAPEKLSAANAA